MIPLSDDNPTARPPVVTLALIAVCTLVFLFQQAQPEHLLQAQIYSYGLIPAVFFGLESLPRHLDQIPPALTIVTSMFIHGGWLHLLSNMLYLWIFGNNIEDAAGHFRFVLFYLASGAAGALAQALSDPGSTMPMVGASGAISGVLGGYLLLFPHARVKILLPIGWIPFTFDVLAILVLGGWFVMQFLSTAFGGGEPGGGVAYWAHIGGFVAGMALILVLRGRNYPLFGSVGRRVGRRPE